MFSSSNPHFMNIIEHRFSTPSGNYFWQRKFLKVQNLLRACLGLLEPANSRSSQAFVELGCGNGVDLYWLRENLALHTPDWQLSGIDADPTSLEICALKKEFYGADNVDLIKGDITRPLPFEDGSVDILYCSEVIEHLTDPDSLLLEIRRVLKNPGGYLILTTPNEPNAFQRSYWLPKRRAALLRQMAELRNESRSVDTDNQNTFLYPHVSLRTTGEWDTALKKAGFRNVRHERGAIVYGATPFFDNEWIMGIRFLFEACLDLLPTPVSHRLSDQLIGLYETC